MSDHQLGPVDLWGIAIVHVKHATIGLEGELRDTTKANVGFWPDAPPLELNQDVGGGLRGWR